MVKTALVRPDLGPEHMEFQEPLGAEALCGYLRNKGINCRVFDRQLDRLTGRNTVSAIREYDPDFIGFSIMTREEVDDAARMLQMLKGRAKFMAGGLFVTTDHRMAKALFPADTYLIRGEGEAAVLSYITGEDMHHLSPDEWAFASRDDMDMYLSRGGVINIRSSAGCPGVCDFCATPNLPNDEHLWRARSVDLIVDEMEMLSQRFSPVFNFVDDHFGPVSRVRSLVFELDRRNVRAAFSLELRPDELIKADLAALSELHEGGLCRIFAGLESISPDVQRSFGKITDSEAFFEAVCRCREAGIEPSVGYILWHKDSTCDSVIKEAAILRKYGLFNVKTALSRMILFPGSRRAGPDVRTPIPEPLSYGARSLYSEMSKRLAPLMDLWTSEAVKLPGAVCRDFLYHTDEARLIKDSLSRSDEICWESLEGMKL